MKIPFQAVSTMWAHAQSAYSDITDNAFLTRFFTNSNIDVYPVRNETCCRTDVVFLRREQVGSEIVHKDILVEAVSEGFCDFAGKVINVEQQFELNGTDKVYYFCPFSPVYKSLVCYRTSDGQINYATAVPEPSREAENTQQQQQGQLVSMQRQQRQGAVAASNHRQNHPQNGFRGRNGHGKRGPGPKGQGHNQG